MKRTRIIFYGNFGAGNLGNECTLQAAIEQIRARWPDAELECLCTFPEDVRSRHRIAAYRSNTLELPGSWDAAGAGATPAPGAPPQRGPLSRIVRLVGHRLPLELAHWLRCLRIVRGATLLVVPGTQIVSDYLCGPSGWPYDIFKLSMLAALCRVKLVFLSIGVGPIRHPLSRWLIKRSLRRAGYRSYRDEGSKRYLDNVGFDTRGDAISPDLVFGLSPHHLQTGAAAARRRPTIGVGLKDYFGDDGDAGSEAYRAYLSVMAQFVGWLCARDYRVRLLIGDVQYDTRVREDLLELLRRNAAPGVPTEVVAEPALAVPELLRQIAETDAVVSPRFHNLVLALMLDKPVIALSDHAKLDSLLAGLKLTRYCVPLDDLAIATLIGRFEELEANSALLKAHIRAEVEKYRVALERQYAAV